MALTSSNSVTDIDTPANTVVVLNQAGNSVRVTMGAEFRVVAGHSLLAAIEEVNASSAAYAKSISLDASEEGVLTIFRGTGSGIYLLADLVSRRVVYSELLDAVENAINA